MTDDRPQPDTPSPLPSASPARLSVLAVLSLAMAIVPLCPPANLLAAGLGMLAYRRIAASGGRLRGQNVARAAIIAGLVLAVMSYVLLTQFASAAQRRMDEVIVRDTELMIRAAQTGDLAVMRSLMVSAGKGVSDDTLSGFGATLRDRYGPLQRMTVVSTLRTGSMLTLDMELAVLFEFEQADQNGSFEINLQYSSLYDEPTAAVISLLVEDPARGDLSLSPGAD